jgi:hypothetical protein
MPEYEDAILPDDFQMDTTPEEVTEQVEIDTPVETVEDTTPTEQTEQQKQEALQALRVKFNHEEREIPIDEAIPLVQKGLNYDKTLERLQALESDPRLSFVEELAQQFNMDVPTYLEAVKAQREEQRIQELVEQGISTELAQEMLENRKFREQFEQEKKTKADEAQKNEEYNEFFNYFREANGRDYQPNQDNIPDSVWEAANNGVPLKFAYMQHENQQIKQQLQTFKQNQSNAQKAPVGSVTNHGSTETASEDVFMQGFNSIK